MPTALQLRGQRAREALGQLHVAAAAERRHRRPLGERRLQPRDAAAFLIDADPQRQVGRQPAPPRDDSSATCSGSAMLRANRITPPSPNSRASDRSSTGNLLPVEAGDQQLADLTAKRARRHDAIKF